MSSDKFAVKIENTIRIFQKPLKYVKAQKVTIYKAILLFFTLLFLWDTYENYWIIFFNDNIYPYLHISWNKISICLYTLIMSGIIYLLIQAYKNKYIISAFQMSLSLIFIIIYSFYRFQSYYINGQILGYLWYLDLLVSTLSVFIILATINIIKCLLPKTGNEANADFCLISDRPIAKAEDDILNYSSEIEKLTKKLETLNLERSWSIGITSVWGGGKTSFLNLLEESIRKHKNFIVVKFNPRNSKNTASIQEDFFSVICSALKPYNSCFSKMFKDYMKTLQLFDKENIINTIFNLRKIADKNSEKVKLDTALKLLNKKVIIFIDDLDRLLAEEIIEVFKLIDDNASFPNLIFLTAYDKKHISTIINETYRNEATLFSDKFFNYEEIVPIRNYRYIYNYLKEKLSKELKAEDGVVEQYEEILEMYQPLVKKHLDTLRDIKRFLNIFLKDYKPLQRELNFEDYFLLTIIKYKNPEVHKNLYKKEYLQVHGHKYKAIDSNKTEFSDILQILFPNNDTDNPYNNYRRIYDIRTFESYFCNYVDGQLSISFMENIFKENIGLIKETINSWEKDNKIYDFIEFLNRKNEVRFDGKDDLKKYIYIMFYISMKKEKINILQYLLELTRERTVNEISETYNFTKEDYKIFILGILKENNNSTFHYRALRALLITTIKGPIPNIIFTKYEILQISKTLLKEYTDQKPVMNQQHIYLLYTCIKEIDPQTGKISLDEESCSKISTLIKQSPQYYISTFVRTSGDKIGCEPFYEQIFENKEAFKDFIFNTNLDDLSGIKTVRNFWELYRNNDYKDIPSENAQKDIDENLITLSEKLNKLKAIEVEFETFKNSDSEQRSRNNIEMYQYLMQKIDENRLYIKMTGSLRANIEKWFKNS